MPELVEILFKQHLYLDGRRNGKEIEKVDLDAAEISPKGFHRAAKTLVLHTLHTDEVPGWYEPDAFEVFYQGNNLTKIELRPDYDYASPMVVRAHMDDLNKYRPLVDDIVHWDNMGASANIQISEGCSSGGLCRFCHEANMYGKWTERDIDNVREAVVEAVISQGADIP